MLITILPVAAACFAIAFVGGAVGLSFRDHKHLVIGVSSGVAVGLAFFVLLPKATDLGISIQTATTLTAIGFFLYLVLDRVVMASQEKEDLIHSGEFVSRSVFGALVFPVRAFISGVAVGVGFQVSLLVGALLTVAVLMHNFSGGMQVVNTVLTNGGTQSRAIRWLFVYAFASVFGVAITLVTETTSAMLSPVLAVLSGVFLYLGTNDVIPETYHRHPRIAVTMMAILGVLSIYVFALPII